MCKDVKPFTYIISKEYSIILIISFVTAFNYNLGFNPKITSAPKRYNLKVILNNSAANKVIITNQNPEHLIIVSGIKIDGKDNYIINSTKEPQFKNQISWFYDIDTGYLMIQTIEKGINESIEIDFIINLAQDIEFGPPECKVFLGDIQLTNIVTELKN